MTFEKLNIDTNCDCLKGSVEDSENEYFRRLKRQVCSDDDFLTHWERGINKDSTDCRIICSTKGVSVNVIENENNEQIIDKYKVTFSINPKIGNHLLKFKLKSGAGMVKRAKTKDNTSHCNFYKADDFTLSNLDIIETIRYE